MAVVVVVAAGILSGCGRARELELVSTAPGTARSVVVFLEYGSKFFAAELLLEVADGDTQTVLRRDDIARVTRVQAKDELYELGVCGAEIAWPDRDVSAIFVKNCLGSTTFVAYDFRQRRLTPGDPYADSLRRALRDRYRKEMGTFDGDPLEWARGPRMDDAYRGRKVGNGRLLGDP